MKKILLTLVLLTITITSNSQTIFGNWHSTNEDTGEIDSVIEVYEKDGKAFAKIIDIKDVKRKNAVCDLCEDENKNKPIPQKGKVTIFKRRTPEQSNIINLETLQKVYDQIRMLDADGYPKAYLESKFLKLEFKEANFKNKNEIKATVSIKIKKDD